MIVFNMKNQGVKNEKCINMEGCMVKKKTVCFYRISNTVFKVFKAEFELVIEFTQRSKY